MENIISELEKRGYDVMTIINGTRDKKVLCSFYKNKKNRDIVISDWSDEDIDKFIRKVYNIITKYDKVG